MSEISKLTADDCLNLSTKAESPLMTELLIYVYKNLNKLRKKRVKKFLDCCSLLNKPITDVDGLIKYLNDVKNNKETLEKLFKTNVEVCLRDVKEFLNMFTKNLPTQSVYRELI